MWIKIKKFFLDLFFPIRCFGCGREGFFLCQNCSDGIPLLIPSSFANPCPHLDKILAAFDYHHPLIKKSVKTMKYPPYAYFLSENLGRLLIKYLKIEDSYSGAVSYLTRNNFVLMPIPIFKQKLNWRGFNQSELLAKELSQEFNWPLNSKLLKKTENNQSQTNLNARQRKTNIKNVFAVAKSFKNALPKNIILVDDVLTTGATLEEAAKTLRRAGVKEIWGIVLAKE